MTLPAFSEVKDYILFALAIYAAVLSTWNLRQSLLKDRRRIRVTAGSTLPTYDGGKVGNTWADLKATNLGQRPVTVTCLTFELPQGGRLFRMSNGGGIPNMPDTALPAVLSDGQFACVLISYREIGEALLGHGLGGKTKITPVCEDSSGTTHKGEAWDVDPHELIHM